MDPKYGYYPNPSKSDIIVKEEHLDKAKFTFKGREVKITKNDQRHLEAVIGSKELKQEYFESMFNNWNDQLDQLIYLFMLLKWNLLLGALKASLNIFIKQFLIIIDISNL